MTCNDHPAGHNGYVSPAIKDKGIHSVFYMDGPAGIGRTAWPTEMLLACAFNKEAWYRFGEAVGAECEEAQVDVWLAPAVNLHRNPLCGRNFEYFQKILFLQECVPAQLQKAYRKIIRYWCVQSISQLMSRKPTAGETQRNSMTQ